MLKLSWWYNMHDYLHILPKLALLWCNVINVVLLTCSPYLAIWQQIAITQQIDSCYCHTIHNHQATALMPANAIYQALKTCFWGVLTSELLTITDCPMSTCPVSAIAFTMSSCIKPYWTQRCSKKCKGWQITAVHLLTHDSASTLLQMCTTMVSVQWCSWPKLRHWHFCILRHGKIGQASSPFAHTQCTQSPWTVWCFCLKWCGHPTLCQL